MVGIGTARWRTLALGLGLASCTRVSDTERFAPDHEALVIVRTVPDAGAHGVDPDAAIDLCFSHTVDPRSIAPTDATMSSGETPIDSETSVQLLPWTDPGGVDVAADATAPWCSGSVMSVRPKAPLFAGLRYRLRLVPRVSGWNGEILDTEQPGWTPEGSRMRYYLEFTVDDAPDPERTDDGTGGDATDSTGDTDTTGDTDGTGDTDDIGDTDGAESGPDGPTLADLFAPGQLFDPARPTCSCHRDPDDLALRRIDLRDAARAYDALVLDARPRETGFALVAPRRPSESFLVQKLVRDHDGAPLEGILGDAMPPEGGLPYADYVMIARWIAAGALP